MRMRARATVNGLRSRLTYTLLLWRPTPFDSHVFSGELQLTTLSFLNFEIVDGWYASTGGSFQTHVAWSARSSARHVLACECAEPGVAGPPLHQCHHAVFLLREETWVSVCKFAMCGVLVRETG